MSQTEALRSSILQEADGFASRRRFGLFNSPVPVAIGDDGQFKAKLHPRDQSGKPVTQVRGIFTNPVRSGQMKKSYFGGINSLASGEVHEEYVDPDFKLLQIQNQTFRKGYTKDQAFKPASGFKQTAPVPYEYKPENNPERDPKRNRDQNGFVKVTPRNFVANQQSTVITTSFKPIKYMEDPYERAHQTEVDHNKKQKSLEPEARYKLNLHPKQTFTSAKQIFGTEVQFPEKKVKDPKFNIYSHEAKWKSSNPNRSGLYGYLAPFPSYMENPAKEATRRAKVEGGRDSFRRMSVANSTPSPSIALNRSNLSKTISHSVSHRR